MRDLDNWPERIGIPSIEQSVTVLLFVEDCLNDETTRQRAAKDHVRLALGQLSLALASLK